MGQQKILKRTIKSESTVIIVQPSLNGIAFTNKSKKLTPKTFFIKQQNKEK